MIRLFALLALTLAAGAASAQSSLVVVNRSDDAVYYFYASSCSSNGWGDDRLGSDVISAGDSYTFDITPGCWDFKVRFADGDELTESRQQVRRGASLTWTLGDGGGAAPARGFRTPGGRGTGSNTGTSSGSFVVVNRTDQSLMYLYASACSRDDWGDDQLGSDVVGAGDSYTFTITPGCWDFKARFADGQETIQRRQNIQSGGSLRWNINSN